MLCRIGLRGRANSLKKFQIEAESMEYFEPRSVSEALSVLAKHGAEAKIIAGGTDVMVDIKFKEEPGGLVNIKKIPGLSGISENGAGVRIGPLTTIREIETRSEEHTSELQPRF